ncbi:MAG: hypothetical protein GY749_34110 [Desulfobacteraceae bacterium]|nr:hypothetical protein [Desulfobacteraceae bacterium]
MKKTAIILLAFGLFSGITSIAAAGEYASETIGVSYDIKEINNLEIENPNMNFVIEGGSSGGNSLTETVINYYNIATNHLPSVKLTAKLNADMPAGITLHMDAETPGTGTKNPGYLSATPHDVITGITPVSATHKKMEFTFTVTAEANPTPGSRSVILTLTD